MNIQKFVANSSREALGKARMALGQSAVILSNRSTELGVEVIAATEDSLSALHDKPASAKDVSSGKSNIAQVAAAAAAAAVRHVAHAAQHEGPPSQAAELLAQRAPAADADRLAMSTLSFQDYVRERAMRKRAESQAPAAPARSEPVEAPVEKPVAVAATPLAATSSSLDADRLLAEMHSLRMLVDQRLSTMAWLGQAQVHPLQPHLVLKLLRAGFSPQLSRALVEQLPAALTPGESMQWMMQALTRNLRTDAPGPSLEAEGGVYALIGPPGAGKTTTTAKMAAVAAAKHGANAVGLVTLDTQRAGAHDQLRAHGQALGVVAHPAHDAAALHDLLQLFASKKVVLIDTAGSAPRDERTQELLALLDAARIRKVMVMPASMDGESLEDAMHAFGAREAAGVALTRLDEAVKFGAPLDALIRHKLMLRGVADGDRVPQDWHRPDAAELIRQALRAPRRAAFAPQAEDLGLMFAQTAPNWSDSLPQQAQQSAPQPL